MAAEEPPKPPYFLIFDSASEATSPLAITAGGRAAIPLFGSAQRARDFLLATDFGPGLEPFEVSAERLVETLEAHRDLVDYVAHDPPPLTEDGMRVRMGKLADLVDSLRERARSEMGLFDIGGPGLN